MQVGIVVGNAERLAVSKGAAERDRAFAVSSFDFTNAALRCAADLDHISEVLPTAQFSRASWGQQWGNSGSSRSNFTLKFDSRRLHQRLPRAAGVQVHTDLLAGWNCIRAAENLARITLQTRLLSMSTQRRVGFGRAMAPVAPLTPAAWRFLPCDVVLKLLNCESLLGDDVLNQVPDRDNAYQFATLDNGEVA